MEDYVSSSDLEYYQSLNWEWKQWRPSPALIEKKSKSSTQYVGQRYDPTFFDLVEDGWNHDHCEICSAVFCDNPELCNVEGFESENNWICKNCFSKYIE